ncbi:hypothetical protein H9P43_006958 [Blastocladiella emersonii ATCC 22665]|nr:hypothetical protein H9P43_006958 [Blastocladiella emersonii ATCC 22665]
MNPYPEPCSILVIDNASFHHSHRHIAELEREFGIAASLISHPITGLDKDDLPHAYAERYFDCITPALLTPRPSPPGRRLSAAHKSKFDLLRRPATTAVASVKFEIKSLNIKEW